MQIFATTYEASDAMKSLLVILNFVWREAAQLLWTHNGGSGDIRYMSAEALARLPRLCWSSSKPCRISSPRPPSCRSIYCIQSAPNVEIFKPIELAQKGSLIGVVDWLKNAALPFRACDHLHSDAVVFRLKYVQSHKNGVKLHPSFSVCTVTLCDPWTMSDHLAHICAITRLPRRLGKKWWLYQYT